MIYQRYNRAITTGMTVTALTLTAAFSPVQAQLNNNAFFPSAPRILAPLGGGILGSQSNFGSPLRNLNPRFNTFSGQLAGFNANRGAFANQFVDYNAQLAAFNSQRTAFNSQFDRFTANNVRFADFNTANLNFAADGTFFQSNPSLNPLAVNGPATGSIGFNGFNTFNSMNPSATGFRTFNTLANNFGGAGVPVAAQVQNLVRPVSGPGSTQPIRQVTTNGPFFANPRLDAHMSTTGVATSNQISAVRPITTYGPFFSNPRLDAQMSMSAGPNSNQMMAVRPITTYGPFFSNPRLDAQMSNTGVASWNWNQSMAVRPVTTYGPFFSNPYLDSGRVRSAFGAGLGNGTVVMGGRSAR